ncbi:MAG: type II CAAX prenyl endopeptidase Rce1 family protein [Planctomycetota bacterium]
MRCTPEPLRPRSSTDTHSGRLRRSQTLLLPLEENRHLRHPLTVLVAVVPAALVAELFRFLAPLDEALITDATVLRLSEEAGLSVPILMPIVLLLGCLGVQLLWYRDWRWPSLGTLSQILAWGLVWSVVRLVVGITSGALNPDMVASDQMPGLLDPRAGHELNLLNIVGLAFSGAVHEEVLFRAIGIGGLAVLLLPFRLPWRLAQYCCLPLATAAFAMAHSDIINHAAASPAPEWDLLVQHGVAGALYGIIFIRQGLAVAIWAHCLYNVALGLGVAI